MPELSPAPWSESKKYFFRFFFVYFILYVLPFPLSVLPFYDQIDFSIAMWKPLVAFTGSYILQIGDIDIFPNGSGDTTWNYVQVFAIALLSIIGSIVWSVADRKRTDYNKLADILSVVMRYYLATTMISYGMYKIIKTQFPFPHIGRLLQPYGDSSPMGLLWTFMGFSTIYCIFTGIAEFLGGFLLFFRRTRLIGCMVCIGVMTNVVLMNFTFDVPVKLFSSHLLLIAFFLAAPDLWRLLNFFILNKSVDGEIIQTRFQGTKWFYPYVIGKMLFIIVPIGFLIYSIWGYYRTEFADGGTKPPFHGVFEVDVHVANGDTLAPLTTDGKRWKRVIINTSAWSEVEYMDNSRVNWTFSSDTLQKTMKIMSMDSATVYNFTYERTDNVYTWKGGDAKYDLYFKMRHKRPQDFLLVNRGFNWINEYPFNR